MPQINSFITPGMYLCIWIQQAKLFNDRVNVLFTNLMAPYPEGSRNAHFFLYDTNTAYFAMTCDNEK